MKTRTYNIIIIILVVVGVFGYMIFKNGLFLAGAVLFGVWSLVNLLEYLIKDYFKKKPLTMVKE